MKVPFRLNTVALTVGLAGALLAGAAQAQNIKIGVVIPATGPLTQYGDMVKEGVDTALEQINAAGGVNGNKLEAVIVDDACEPKQGPVAANRVVNAKIQYVVGPVCSGAAIAAAPIYNNEGVVVVTPSATSPALTEGKKDTTVFFRADKTVDYETMMKVMDTLHQAGYLKIGLVGEETVKAK